MSNAHASSCGSLRTPRCVWACHVCGGIATPPPHCGCHAAPPAQEPVPFWDTVSTRAVKALGKVRVAAGENEYRMDIFQRMLAPQSASVDIVQPDFGYAGGFSNALRVAKWAAEAGVVTDPHSPDKSMTEFFATHLLGAIPNPGPALEYGCVDPTDISRQVFVEPLEISANGTVRVPLARAGWGVEIKPSWLEAATARSFPPPGGEVLGGAGGGGAPVAPRKGI